MGWSLALRTVDLLSGGSLRLKSVPAARDNGGWKPPLRQTLALSPNRSPDQRIELPGLRASTCRSVSATTGLDSAPSRLRS